MARITVDDGEVDVNINIDEYLGEATDKALIAELEEREIDYQRRWTEEELADLATFVRLARSDPDSAAVYFHRATGRHLFEVQQPCLL